MKFSRHVLRILMLLSLATVVAACSGKTDAGATGTGDGDKSGSDTTAPTVSTNRSGWYTVATDVAITAADVESGVAWTKYQWDTNDACLSGSAYTAPIPIPTGGGTLHTLYMCVQDNAGIQGTASATMAVDTTAPLLSADKSGWFTDATNVTLSVTDAESGLSWTKYQWDTDNACTSGLSYLGPIPIPTANGSLHTLYICAQNNAGAQATAGTTVGLDTTAPLVAADKSGWQTVATDVFITSVDPESGIAWTRYEWDSDVACLAGESYVGEIPIFYGDGALHTLFMCAQNNAGTVGFSSQTMAVDTTAPTGVSISYTAGYVTSTSLAITTGTPSDSESGIASSGLQYMSVALSSGSCGAWGSTWTPATLSGGNFTATSGNCYRFRAYAINGAGLRTDSSAGGDVKVDTSGTTGVTISYTAGYVTSTSLAITTGTPSDSESGIASSGLQYMSVALSSGSCGAWGSTWTPATLSGGNFTATSGNCYRFRAYAINGAGLRTDSSAGGDVKVDTSGTTGVSVTYSAGYTSSTSLAITTGTPSDSESGIASSGVEYMSVALSGGACGTWGSSWAAATLVSGNFTATSGNCYRFRAYAINGAGLRTDSSAGGDVKVDATAPTGVSVTYSAGYVTSTSLAITTGTPSDSESGIASSGLQYMSVALSSGSCGAWGSTWTPATLSGGNFTATSGNCYRFRAYAINGAGLRTDSSAGGDVKVDATAPTVSANQTGWFTTATDVAITAIDAQSGIAWVKFKWDVNDACATGTDYAATPTPILTGNGGLRTLYMCAQNNTGTTSTGSASMAVDTTAPTSVTVSYASGCAPVPTIDVSSTGSDSDSGIAVNHIEFQTALLGADGSCNSTWSNWATATINAGVFTGINGMCYRFRSYYENGAGLSATSADGGDAKVSVCGDSILCSDIESCDDGHATSCGTCNATCTGPGSVPTCGDGILCSDTEACDDGGSSVYCTASCRTRPVVVTGDQHACALTSWGGVTCWGFNDTGQLGDGTTTSRNSPQGVVGLTAGVAAVAAGGGHSCALTTTGGVKCWGGNSAGQLGDGTTTKRLSPVDVVGLSSGIASITAGYQHTCARTTAGGVKCWGLNDYGQLGDGTTTNRNTPVNVSGLASGIASVSAGHQHGCALTSSGGGRCWGRGTLGQLGDGAGTSSSTPTFVTYYGSSGLASISAGGNHTCGVTALGAANCWGLNQMGQLGDGTTVGGRLVPVNVLGFSNNVSFIVAGFRHSCALTTSGGARCWGYNHYGQNGDGTTNDGNTPVNVNSLAAGVATMASGYDHSCAMTTSETIKCWGSNVFGQVGDGTANTDHVPVDVVGLTSGTAFVFAGYEQECAVTSGGGAKCWGNNQFGQLGDGTKIDQQLPVDVSGLTSGVASVASGIYHACALTTSGGVKCWGANPFGQLGNGTTTDSVVPIDVTGLTSGAAAIAVGLNHSCALTTAGGVKCWGLNDNGPVGDGTSTDRYTPVNVSGLTSGAAAISAGFYHSCARTTSGGIKCWGYNGFGQVGDGTTIDRHTPVNSTGMASGVAKLATGAYHTCVVTTSGAARCWGNNDYGQLGDGTTTWRHVFVAVSGLPSGVASIAAGLEHTCAVTTLGQAKCWGLNSYGQLGDGTATSHYTPVDVVGLSSDATTPTAGNYHSCVRTTTGGIKCWGFSEHGQLGDGAAWYTTPRGVVGF